MDWQGLHLPDAATAISDSSRLRASCKAPAIAAGLRRSARATWPQLRLSK